MNPIVYITQVNSRPVLNGVREPSIDINPATEFGSIKELVPMGPNFESGSDIVDAMTEGLKDFRPTVDYLLPMSDPVMMVAAGAVLASKGVVFIRCLRWDRHSACYKPFTLEL